MKPLLSLRNVHKRFAAVHALKGIDLEVNGGEILAIVGENGAGKSTLIKILCGMISQEEGELYFEDEKLTDLNPGKSKRLGIRAVQQHFSLIPTMSVAENIYFDVLKQNKKRGLINWKKIIDEAQSFLNSIGYNQIDARSKIKDLSVADCQRIEVAKAIRSNSKVLILDEPSAVLPETDVLQLFSMLREVRKEGTAIIYISHHLDEVFEIADRIAVLKDGELVKVIDEPDTIDHFGLIKLMVGRDINDIYPPVRERGTKTVLSVKNLSTAKVHDISLDLHEGEILGIAGLVGAGRTELCRTLFGMDVIKDGTITINGSPYQARNPMDAIRHSLSYVTEDRHFDGLILGESLATNISFVGSRKVTRHKLISKKLNLSVADRFIKELDIKTPSPAQLVYYLSGGNQQKVVLAKWLFIEPRIMLLDEATRGIDVGAKREIYYLINELARTGVSIIMVSSELQEIIQLSHRILVMREGRIVAEFGRDEATEEGIIGKASGL